ncbi:MAG: RNA methyltransferase substrate-binding domain-containing protein, partial [Nesterenkonia sp.]
MAHDSRPKTAAVRKERKGPTKGSGGQGKRKLAGKGPTPKAEDRVYHKAHRQKQLAQRSKTKRETSGSRSRGSGYGADDVVAGRNATVEALAERVPAVELLIATDIDSDGRVRDALQHCAEQNVRVKEVTRRHLDAATGDAVHQGVALVLEPYEYAEAVDLIERLQQQASKGHIAHAPLLIACD